MKSITYMTLILAFAFSISVYGKKEYNCPRYQYIDPVFPSTVSEDGQDFCIAKGITGSDDSRNVVFGPFDLKMPCTDTCECTIKRIYNTFKNNSTVTAETWLWGGVAGQWGITCFYKFRDGTRLIFHSSDKTKIYAKKCDQSTVVCND